MTARDASIFVACSCSPAGSPPACVLTGRMRESATKPARRAPAPGAGRRDAGTAPAGRARHAADFSRVAERTVPAVANISSQQVVRRQNSPFANDPFFQFFFGDADDIFGSRRGVESSLGSGVIVSADGYILTNNHVVAGESRPHLAASSSDVTVALADKREMPAHDRRRRSGDRPGAAEDRRAATCRRFRGATRRKLKVAEWVLAIGNPFQLNQTVTLGIVSARRPHQSRHLGLRGLHPDRRRDQPGQLRRRAGQRARRAGRHQHGRSSARAAATRASASPCSSNLARRVVNDLQQYGEVRRGSIGYVGRSRR